MSILSDLSDAIAAELNTAPAETFSQAFTAVRKALPVYELSDLAELKVTVVPKAVDISGSTRSASQYDLSVDIGIQQKLATTDVDTEVAALGTLVDEIAEYLRRRPLAAAPFAAWVRTVNDPVYAPEHLRDSRVFTSVLTITYRAIK